MRVTAKLDQGYNSSKAPDDHSPGELTKSIGCEYRRGDPDTLWKIPGRTRLAQPSGGSFPVYGVKIGTFDDSTKDVVYCISNNKLFAVSIASGSVTELAGDLSDVRERRHLSGAHMNNHWFLTSGLNRNSVTDQGGNHREMGMLAPENALTVTPVGAVGSKIPADGNAGDFTDPEKAYDADGGTFARATLDGNPLTPGVSPSVQTHTFTWTDISTGPREARCYIWLRPYNVPGGTEVDQPEYDVPSEVECVVEISENSGTDWTELYRGTATDHPFNVTARVTAAANLVQVRFSLIYPHDQGSGNVDTSGSSMTLRVYNVEQRTGTEEAQYTHESDQKNVVAYTEYDSATGLESGVSAESSVIFSAQNTYALTGFAASNPNTTHFKIYRTPFVPRNTGTGREISSGFKSQMGLVDMIPVSSAEWTDPLEVPLDIQLPNLLEQVLIVGGSNITPIAYDVNQPPPRFSHISVFKGQLVGVYGRTLRASMPGRPESWPLPYVINSFPLAENDTLVATHPIGDILCIGARSVMMSIDQLPRVDRNGQFTTGRLRTVADFGLVGPKAMTAISMGSDGEDLIAWVSPAGIHVSNGFTSRRVTQDIDWNRELADADLSDSCLEFNPGTMQLKFSYGDRFALLHFDPMHMKEGGLPKITWNHYGKLLDIAYAARQAPIEVSGHKDDGYVYIERDGFVDESNSYSPDGRIPYHFERHFEIEGHNTKMTFVQALYRVDLAERITHIDATSTARITTSYSEQRTLKRKLTMKLDGSEFWLVDRAGEGILLDLFTDDNADFGVTKLRVDIFKAAKAREQVL